MFQCHAWSAPATSCLGERNKPCGAGSGGRVQRNRHGQHDVLFCSYGVRSGASSSGFNGMAREQSVPRVWPSGDGTGAVLPQKCIDIVFTLKYRFLYVTRNYLPLKFRIVGTK